MIPFLSEIKWNASSTSQHYEVHILYSINYFCVTNFTAENSRLEDIDVRNMICRTHHQVTFCYKKKSLLDASERVNSSGKLRSKNDEVWDKKTYYLSKF